MNHISLKLITLCSIFVAAAAGVSCAAEAPALYAAKCASCHAKDGKGNAAMAKVFKVEPAALDLAKKATLDKSDADLEKIVAEGLNKMPAYKGKLTAEEIKGVTAYIRSLAAPKEPAK